MTYIAAYSASMNESAFSNLQAFQSFFFFFFCKALKRKALERIAFMSVCRILEHCISELTSILCTSF